jgi:hypothetical protein
MRKIWFRDEKKIGSGIRNGKNSDPGSGMVKILIRDLDWKKFGSGIQNRKNSDPGSRLEKIRIRDPDKHLGSAALRSFIFFRGIGPYRRLGSSSDFLQEILALLLPFFLLVLHLLPLILSRLPASTVIPNNETYPLLTQEKLAGVQRTT